MKLKLKLCRMIWPVTGRTGYALCDENDNVLPGQRRVDVISTIDEPVIAKVEFIIDETNIKWITDDTQENS